MNDRILMKITEVFDDDSGIWDIGEIEFGISVMLLERYLKIYGKKGKEEIIKMLEFLKTKVEEYWLNQPCNPKQSGVNKERE